MPIQSVSEIENTRKMLLKQIEIKKLNANWLSGDLRLGYLQALDEMAAMVQEYVQGY